jgi:rare lipoprotein A
LLKASRLLWILLLFGAFMAFGNDRAEADTALASWYGPGFDGQLTASGEVFDAYGYTAAHNTLPLGTEITVSYAGRSVDVVVNDRGPYSGGRDLDLSQGAAEYLGLTTAGVDYVDYQVAGSGGYASDDGYAAADTYDETDYAEAEYQEAEYAEADYAEVDYEDGTGGEAASGGAYVVQSGDTITGIAAELGTSVDNLMAANGLTDPDVLYAGQTLSY